MASELCRGEEEGLLPPHKLFSHMLGVVIAPILLIHVQRIKEGQVM